MWRKSAGLRLIDKTAQTSKMSVLPQKPAQKIKFGGELNLRGGPKI